VVHVEIASLDAPLLSFTDISHLLRCSFLAVIGACLFMVRVYFVFLEYFLAVGVLTGI
jgi:hypothetical protein